MISSYYEGLMSSLHPGANPDQTILPKFLGSPCKRVYWRNGEPYRSEWLTLTTRATTDVGEGAEKEDLFALLVGMQTGAATLENSMEVLKKLKIELPYDPAITLLGIYQRDPGMLFWRGRCTPMFTAPLSTIAKVWKEPKCPLMGEWIKKMWYIYTMEYWQ